MKVVTPDSSSSKETKTSGMICWHCAIGVAAAGGVGGVTSITTGATQFTTSTSDFSSSSVMASFWGTNIAKLFVCN